MLDFAGCWSIRRQIDDKLNNSTGEMVGRVDFRPIPDRSGALLCQEQGQLTLNGVSTMATERCYVWVGNGPHRIDVEFEDGRHFHSIDTSRTMPDAEHFCEPDHYQAQYDFRDWPVWHCEWRVLGPRKNYRLKTRYRYMGDVSRVGPACVQGAAGAKSDQNLD